MNLLFYLPDFVIQKDIKNGLERFSRAIKGGESHKVGELSTVVVFELEAYPEPKILTSNELKPLMRVWGSTVAVAKFLGCRPIACVRTIKFKN